MKILTWTNNFEQLVSSSLSQTFAGRNSSIRSADAPLWPISNHILSKNDIFGCLRRPYDHPLGMGWLIQNDNWTNNFEQLVSLSFSQTFTGCNSSIRSVDTPLRPISNQVLSKNDIFGCPRRPYDHPLDMGWFFNSYILNDNWTNNFEQLVSSSLSQTFVGCNSSIRSPDTPLRPNQILSNNYIFGFPFGCLSQ